MKLIHYRILLLLTLSFSFSGFSQNYNSLWNKVIPLENDGKIKSAAAVVDKIYAKASQSNNEVQLIKCFFYKSKYLLTLQEDAQTTIIKNLHDEITKAPPATKALLNLIYARSLKSYLDKNHYKLYRRTDIDSTTDNDFSSWTSKKIQAEIDNAYTQTLKDEVILKKTSLIPYEPIFDYFTLDKFNQSTLYDYILQANIDYYVTATNEWLIQKLNQPEYTKRLLGSTIEFNTFRFDSITSQPIRKVLELYQKATVSQSATELELDRLLFCNKTIIKQDQQLLISLNDLQRRNPDDFLLQKIYFEKAESFNRQASKNKYPEYKNKAIKLLDSIIAIQNNSNTFQKAIIKKRELTLKQLDVQLKNYTYEKENTRAFINYKNVDSLKISFYKINALSFNDSIAKACRSNGKIYAEQKYYLINKKDYFNYTTEVLLPPLALGNYVVYIEDLGDDEAKPKPDYRKLTVTNVAVLTYENNNKYMLQTFDRKTGKPLSNCTLHSDSYDLKTNDQGIAEYTIDPKKTNSDLYYQPITITYEKDTLQVQSNYTRSYNNIDKDSETQLNAKVNFYLDRAIYRPGQTMYFKGIATQTKSDQQSLLPNLLLRVLIEDEDDNEIKSFEVTTNDYGSFTGEFTIPKNGLTGQYTISVEEPDDYEKDRLYDKIKKEHPIWDYTDIDESRSHFRVEEYKRPTFETNFDPIKESYIVNQNISINGTAKSFAGSTISDARVVYRVVRKSYRNNYYRWADNEKTLLSSETKTDANGKFTIPFTAIPDEEFSADDLPIFSYELTADITDNNGETHTANSTVNVGYHSIRLNLSIPNNVIAENKNSITLNSTNLNNQFIPVEGELQLYFIKAFSPKFKDRIFNQPEISTINPADFERLFPYEKADDDNLENDKGTLVFSKKINTLKDKTVALDFISNYKSGHYRAVFKATDKQNHPIESHTLFNLIQKNKNQTPENSLFSVQQLNKNPRQDGFIKIRIDSAVPNLYLSCVGNYKDALFFEDNAISLTGYHKEIKIPLNNAVGNSCDIVLETLFDNQYFKYKTPVDLNEVIPKITFETESFRNKLEPGKTENWSFKIKENNQIAEAEVLASMYDLSLDKFAIENWQGLNNPGRIYHNYYGKTRLGFDNIYFYLHYAYPTISKINYHNEYNRLIWFGFDFSNSNNPNTLKEYKKQITKKEPKPENSNMISGIVKDKTGTLPGANIVVKGTNRSTQSDFDGYYEIEAAIGEVLVFSFTGYKNTNVTVSIPRADVVLDEQSVHLDEVVVEGYAFKSKKATLAYATTTVSSTAMAVGNDMAEVYPDAALVQTLQGQVAGLNVDGRLGVMTGSGKGAGGGIGVIIRGIGAVNSSNEPLYIINGVPTSREDFLKLNPNEVADAKVVKSNEALALYGASAANGVIIITTTKALQELTQVKTRTNKNETAFFYPQLRTDEQGRVRFQFTTPEALTQWKLRLLAHNKKANSGYSEKSVVTQKELMIFPNMPRFLRENDTIVIAAKVANMTTEMKKGIAILQLFDANTMENIDLKMKNSYAVRNFSMTPLGNTSVTWKIAIPEGLQGVDYKVIAKAGNYSDGEESIIPVLTNNILVTESMPVWVRENSKKSYVFTTLKENPSKTHKNHLFTLEYTGNPAWIALQSLPYLMEYEHECAEQTFSKYYSNVLASEIINSNPKIATLLDIWRKSGKPLVKLEQNEELKSLLLAETPWVKDAQSEAIQKQNTAILFDPEKMKSTQDNLLKKLKEKQKSSGGFAWFDGGAENEYITRHILSGLGHLEKLNVKKETVTAFSEITQKAIPYIDSWYLNSNTNSKDGKIWSAQYADMHYLYMRSFYLKSYPLSDKIKTITTRQLQDIKNEWLSYSLYNKGMAALVCYRFGDKETAKKILTSLKETASNNEEWGMYWIENKAGWYWYQAPIETQALLIEAFAEITQDTKSIDAMKVWLLKNKQTKNWATTKATTEAIYALLLQGSDWLSVKDNTKIKVGNTKILTAKLSENDKEAETGYLKLNWKASEITSELSTVTIENNSKVPGYGGVYWQYFEDCDKIKSSDKSSLSVGKELYLKKSTATGMQLQSISSKTPLKVGDLVTVRLIITSKEDVDFIHLKDMRASCFEPINVLSTYEWRDGLSYYLSTKDAATHFFFDRINKGTYILEYDLRVNNKGAFSNGITTIESMYAPEYTHHTKGIRIQVSE